MNVPLTFEFRGLYLSNCSTYLNHIFWASRYDIRQFHFWWQVSLKLDQSKGLFSASAHSAQWETAPEATKKGSFKDVVSFYRYSWLYHIEQLVWQGGLLLQVGLRPGVSVHAVVSVEGGLSTEWYDCMRIIMEVII